MDCVAVAPGVRVISAREGVRMANSYLVDEVEGFFVVEPILNDVEEGRWWVDCVEREHAVGKQFLGVVLTHWHSDHVIGFEALAGHFHVPVYAADPPSEVGERVAVFPTRPIADRFFGWRKILTPGHAPEHVCLFNERTGVLVAGDMVTEGGALIFDEQAFENSIQQLQSLHPDTVLPAHGAVMKGFQS